jgi:cysteine synthase A
MADDATGFIEQTISNPEQPLIIFALEWCEFCWSVRKFCNQVGLDYAAIDLDSVAYQKDAFGQKIRGALAERTGIKTIPQIFIAGEFIGGCTDFFDAWNSGGIQSRLKNNGVIWSDTVVSDPYSFLPEWLHPR